MKTVKYTGEIGLSEVVGPENRIRKGDVKGESVYIYQQ